MSNLLNKEWAHEELYLYGQKHALYGPDADKLNITYNIFKILDEMCKSEEEIIEVYDLLKNLLCYIPLTPIEDIPGEFDELPNKEGIYQCKRHPSLFKKIDGNIISFNDIDRFICIDLEENEDMIVKPYHDRFIEGIVNDIYPIIFPYQPLKQIKIFVDKFRYYKDREKWDTLAITYLRLPSGTTVQIQRYFKHHLKISDKEEVIKDEIVEISTSEYFNRRRKYENRRKKKNG